MEALRPLQNPDVSVFGYVPKSRIAGSNQIVLFQNVLGESPQFPMAAASLCIPTHRVQGSASPVLSLVPGVSIVPPLCTSLGLSDSASFKGVLANTIFSLQFSFLMFLHLGSILTVLPLTLTLEETLTFQKARSKEHHS